MLKGEVVTAMTETTPAESTADLTEGGLDHGRGISRRHRWADLAICLLILVASLGFSAKHVSGHREISPFDEYVYIDYFARVLDDGFVRQGDKTDDFARRYISCHPNRAYGPWKPGLCPQHKPRPDRAYPFAGATTAGLYTPLFFLSTRLMAQPLVWAGMDLVQAGRYAAGMWLAIGGMLLFGALRRMRVRRPVALGATLMMVGSLAAYWGNTYLSTDATALAAGAGMLFVVLGYLRRPSRSTALAVVAVAALASALKIQNLEAVVVGSGMLMMLAALEQVHAEGAALERVRQFLRDSRTRLGIVSMVVGVAVQVVWLVIRALLSLGPDPDLGAGTPFHFPLDAVRDMLQFLPGVAGAGIYGPEVGDWSVISVQILSLVIVGGVIGVGLGRRVTTEERSLGVSVLFAAVVAGPALSFATMVLNHVYVPLPTRYGASILPGMIACAAVLVPGRSRLVRFGFLAVGLVVYGIGLGLHQ